MFSATHPLSDLMASTCSRGTGGHSNSKLLSTGAEVADEAAALHLLATAPLLQLDDEHARSACTLAGAAPCMHPGQEIDQYVQFVCVFT
jgi:hypothetical protein